LGNYLKEKPNYIEHFNCITRAKLIHLSGVIDPASNPNISESSSILLSYLLSQQKGDARVAFKNKFVRCTSVQRRNGRLFASFFFTSHLGIHFGSCSAGKI
jgi:hypothetical protein